MTRTVSSLLAPARASLLEVIRLAGPQTFQVVSGEQRGEVTLHPGETLTFSNEIKGDYPDNVELARIRVQDLAALAHAAATSLVDADDAAREAQEFEQQLARRKLIDARARSGSNLVGHKSVCPPPYSVHNRTTWQDMQTPHWSMLVAVRSSEKTQPGLVQVDFAEDSAQVERVSLTLVESGQVIGTYTP